MTNLPDNSLMVTSGGAAIIAIVICSTSRKSKETSVFREAVCESICSDGVLETCEDEVVGVSPGTSCYIWQSFVTEGAQTTIWWHGMSSLVAVALVT